MHAVVTRGEPVRPRAPASAASPGPGVPPSGESLASEIAQLIERFERALAAMGLGATHAEVERWAVLIHRSMNLGRRKFHTTAHVLAVTRDLPALPTLAGLFHDLVYVQVDDGFPIQVAGRLSELARQVQGGWELTPEVGRGLPSLVAEIFGVSPGQVLGPFTGLNELLSACVAVEALGGTLAPADLARVAASIEATVPFRGPDERGRDPFERLEERLGAVVRSRGLELERRDVEHCIDEALQLANADVVNFADSDPGRFLTNTWTLLPETNRSLIGFGVYSVIEYRQSLQRMASFLHQIDPAVIFHRRGARPAAAEFARMVEQARYNVDIARRYLGVKLYAIALVEAFARLTGGDAPIALFLGDVPAEGVAIRRAEDLLPERPATTTAATDAVLLALLQVGRASPSHFDMQNSPLSSYLYRALGERRIEAGIERSHAMFEGRTGARELLDTLEPEMRADLGRAFAAMVPTRRAALLELAG